RPDESDLWPIVFAVPTRDQQSAARDALREILDRTENQTLPAAAEEASLGRIARAVRIAAAGNQVLRDRPAVDGQEAAHIWRLRLEGIAREVDAGFTIEQMPAELADARARIVNELANHQSGSS